MVKCRVCKKSVSAKAITCPHCGIVNPCDTTNTQKSMSFSLTIGIAGVLVFAFWLTTQNSSTNSSSEKDEKCKLDLQCWSDKYRVAAEANCKDKIMELSTSSAHWTNAVSESKFSHFRWLDKKLATLTFMGDKIELKNTSGAYENNVYECDFDPSSYKVLDVRLKPGLLD